MPPHPQNNIASTNMTDLLEDIKEGSSYHPPTENQQNRGRAPRREIISQRPRENPSDFAKNSPQAAQLLNTTLLNFKVPFVENESRDADDHLQNYKIETRLQGAMGPLLCMAFPPTLRKATKEWFNNLPRGSITSFRELGYAFSN